MFKILCDIVFSLLRNLNIGQKNLGVELGEDAVGIGNLPVGTKIGNRSTYVGPTDSRGNVVLNRPMAIGHNADADGTGIAIGAGARAGTIE